MRLAFTAWVLAALALSTATATPVSSETFTHTFPPAVDQQICGNDADPGRDVGFALSEDPPGIHAFRFSTSERLDFVPLRIQPGAQLFCDPSLRVVIVIRSRDPFSGSHLSVVPYEEVPAMNAVFGAPSTSAASIGDARFGAYDPDRRLVFTASENTVTAHSIPSLAIEDTATAPVENMERLLFDESTQRVILFGEDDQRDDTLAVLDASGGGTDPLGLGVELDLPDEMRVGTPPNSNDIALWQDWALLQDGVGPSGQLLAFSLQTGSLAASIETGDLAGDLAVDPGGPHLWGAGFGPTLLRLPLTSGPTTPFPASPVFEQVALAHPGTGSADGCGSFRAMDAGRDLLFHWCDGNLWAHRLSTLDPLDHAEVPNSPSLACALAPATHVLNLTGYFPRGVRLIATDAVEDGPLGQQVFHLPSDGAQFLEDTVVAIDSTGSVAIIAQDPNESLWALDMETGELRQVLETRAMGHRTYIDHRTGLIHAHVGEVVYAVNPNQADPLIPIAFGSPVPGWLLSGSTSRVVGRPGTGITYFTRSNQLVGRDLLASSGATRSLFQIDPNLFSLVTVFGEVIQVAADGTVMVGYPRRSDIAGLVRTQGDPTDPSHFIEVAELINADALLQSANPSGSYWEGTLRLSPTGEHLFLVDDEPPFTVPTPGYLDMVRVFDRESLDQIQEVRIPRRGLTRFSPDGRHLFVLSGLSETCRILYDPGQPEPLGTPELLPDPPTVGGTPIPGDPWAFEPLFTGDFLHLQYGSHLVTINWRTWEIFGALEVEAAGFLKAVTPHMDWALYIEPSIDNPTPTLHRVRLPYQFDSAGPAWQ